MKRRFVLVFAAAGMLAVTLTAAASSAQKRAEPNAASSAQKRAEPKAASSAQEQAEPKAAEDAGDHTLIERNAQGELTTRDDAAGFGRTGQWAFSSDASIQVQRTTQSVSTGALTTLSLAPAADYFVLPNLSLGGSIGVYYAHAGESSGSRFTIGPRVGYNFEVSRLLSVWPKLSINYAHTGGNAPQIATINPGTMTGNNDNNAIAISIFAPIMVHPAPHFFAGLGPFLESDLSGDNRATSWGIKLTMGGWVSRSASGS
jgi:hypothetical protein